MSSNENKNDLENLKRDYALRFNGNSIEVVRGRECETVDFPDIFREANAVNMEPVAVVRGAAEPKDTEKAKAGAVKATKKGNAGTSKATENDKAAASKATEKDKAAASKATEEANAATTTVSDDTILKNPDLESSHMSAAKRLVARDSYIPESLRCIRIPITHSHKTRLLAELQATKFQRPVCRLIQLSQHKSGKPISSLIKIIEDGIAVDELCDDLAWDLMDYLRALCSDNAEAKQFTEEMEETAKKLGLSEHDMWYTTIDLASMKLREALIGKINKMDPMHTDTIMRIVQIYKFKRSKSVYSLLTMKELGVDYMLVNIALVEEILSYVNALESDDGSAEVLLKEINDSVKLFGFEKFDAIPGKMDLGKKAKPASRKLGLKKRDKLNESVVSSKGKSAEFDQDKHLSTMRETLMNKINNMDSKHHETIMRIVQLYEFDQGRQVYSLLSLNCWGVDYTQIDNALVQEILTYLNALELDQGCADILLKEINDSVRNYGFEKYDQIPGWMDIGKKQVNKSGNKSVDSNKAPASASFDKDKFVETLGHTLVVRANKIDPKYDRTIMRIAQLYDFGQGRRVYSLHTMKKLGINCAKIDYELVEQIFSFLNALEMDDGSADIILKNVYDSARTLGFKKFDAIPGFMELDSQAGPAPAPAEVNKSGEKSVDSNKVPASASYDRDLYLKTMREVLIEKLIMIESMHIVTMKKVIQLYKLDLGRPLYSLLTMNELGVEDSRIGKTLAQKILNYFDAFEIDEECAAVLLKDINEHVSIVGFEKFEKIPEYMDFGNKAGFAPATSSAPGPSTSTSTAARRYAGQRKVKIDGMLYTLDADDNLVSAVRKSSDDETATPVKRPRK